MNKELVKYIIVYFSELMTDDEKLALKHQMFIYKTSDDPVRRQFYTKKGWISTAPEILELLKEGVEAFEMNVAKRIMKDTPEKVFLNDCPKCNQLARTPYAKQCRYCGHSWREAGITES